MANDLLKGINAQNLDALASQGLITPETYQRVQSKIAPVTMSESAPVEQMQPNMAVDPYDAKMAEREQFFKNTAQTPENQENIQNASFVGVPNNPEIDIAEQVRQELQDPEVDIETQTDRIKQLNRLNEIADQEQAADQARLKTQFESELSKVQEYNLQAQKAGLPLRPEPKASDFGIKDAPATAADMEAQRTPTIAEVEEQSAPIRRQAAQQIAKVKEQDKQVQLALQKEQQIAERQKALEDAEAAALRTEQEDNPYGNTWGERLRIALAVGLGSLGKENPALKMIEAKQKQIAENKKLSAEQKIAREKMQLDLAKFELDKMNSATDSQYKRAQIQKLYSEINEKSLAKDIQLKMALRLKDPNGLTQEEVFALDPKEQDAFVRLPNGNFAKAVGEKKAAEKLRDYMAETGTVANELSSLRSLISNPDFSKLSLEDRAAVQSKISALVGALRIPIVGPGPMTDTERKFIVSIIGDPNKFLTLPSVEREKLTSMINTIEGRVRNQYFQAGINLPLSQEERFNKEVDLLKKRNPEVPRDVLEQIRRKNKGQ